MELTKQTSMKPALPPGLVSATLTAHSAPITEEAAHSIAVDAYIYFYPPCGWTSRVSSSRTSNLGRNLAKAR
jgi:hypothetical protein